MPPSPAAPRLTPELRASLYHLTVHTTWGVSSVYFGIWLAHRGISPDEIGIINAAPLFLMLLVNQLVGRIADRMPDWRGAIIVLSLLAGVIPIGLFFVSGFWGILLVWTLSIMPAFSLVSVTDAATLRMTQRRGTSFGNIRGWGTLGFLVTSALVGPLIAVFGDAAFVPIFVTFTLLRAAMSFQLPAFRGDATERQSQAHGGARYLREVLKPWFVLAIAGVAILYASHTILGAFGALLWSEQGIDPSMVGALVATAAAAEAVMMFFWSRLKLKLSARHIILFACLAAAFRWASMAFSPPLWVLFLLQTLHAITFAMGYLGGVYFLANWTSEDIAAEVQGFSHVVQQAMSIVALLIFGWVVGAAGGLAWLVAGVIALIGAACVLISLRLQPLASRQVAPADVPPVADQLP
ncbi:MAG: MFS transporter [Devosia sp.]